MKSYKGIVVQRCYITVTVEVEDETTIAEVSRVMQELADPDKGERESEAYDIELIEENNHGKS